MPEYLHLLVLLAYSLLLEKSNMKKTLALSLFVLSFLLVLSISMISAVPVCNENKGSIWTTRGGCGDQIHDANQYATGEKIYINGKKFECPSYSWSITGKPGGASEDPGIVIASGVQSISSNGTFCIEAYTVKSDDGGVYNVKFGIKKDSYRANEKINNNKNPIPLVPEFGVYVGLLTLVSAVGLFLVIRRK